MMGAGGDDGGRAEVSYEFEAGKRPAEPWGVHRRLWRETYAVLLVWLAVLAAAAYLAIGGSSAARSGPERPIHEVWTEAEGERLADWSLARQGLPSAGPPPVAVLPRLRSDVLPARGGAAGAHSDFDSVSFSMYEQYRSAVASRGEASLDSVRARTLLGLLELSERKLAGSARRVLDYQRALIHSWSRNGPAAERSLAASGCADAQAGERDNLRRGLRAACLWLRGRLAERKAPGSGNADLRAAVTQALATRSPRESQSLFQMQASRHLITAEAADVWRDYLSSLLAKAGPRPLADEDGLVLELAQSTGELRGQPQLAAMLRMLLVRQGRHDLIPGLPEMAEDAGPESRKLWMVAGIVAGLSSDENVPDLTQEDSAELRSWSVHNCRRQQKQGLAGSCDEGASATPAFLEWEEQWEDEIDARLSGRDGLLATIGSYLKTFALLLLAAGLLWLTFVALAIGRTRSAAYRLRMRSDHFAQSSARSRRSRGAAEVSLD